MLGGLSLERLRADMNRLLAQLLHQGVLNEQFLQVQQLQDAATPNFVSELLSIYFRDSEKLLTNLRDLLENKDSTDYKKMDIHLYKFLGSSSTIGAQRVRNVCFAFQTVCEHKNRTGCLRALEMLEIEYCFLKNSLHEYLEIEQKKVLARTVRYPAPAAQQQQQQQPNNP